jgi:Domain of unknown function (DUF1844)
MSLLQSALNKLRGDNSPAPAPSPKPTMPTTPSENNAEMTQRFAQFLMMQAQQIMMMLGLTPSPYGQMPPQLEEAKMFIEQLEMIAVKTKGNLGKQETALLAKVLDQCTLAFTKASGGTPPSLMPNRPTPQIPLDDIVGPMEEDEPRHIPAPQLETKPVAAATTAPAPKPEAQEDSKKKYVKSYGSF